MVKSNNMARESRQLRWMVELSSEASINKRNASVSGGEWLADWWADDDDPEAQRRNTKKQVFTTIEEGLKCSYHWGETTIWWWVQLWSVYSAGRWADDRQVCKLTEPAARGAAPTPGLTLKHWTKQRERENNYSRNILLTPTCTFLCSTLFLCNSNSLTKLFIALFIGGSQSWVGTSRGSQDALQKTDF